MIAINGHKEKEIATHQMFRRMTLIIASTNMGGSKIPSKIDKLWPLPTDEDKKGIDEKAKNVLMSFKKIEAAKKMNNA